MSEGSTQDGLAGPAVRWTGTAFRRNGVTLVALAAVVAVLTVPQQFATRPLLLVVECLTAELQGQVGICSEVLDATVVVPIVVSIAFAFAAFVAQYLVQNCALSMTSGEDPSFAEAATTPHLGRYLLFALVQAALLLVGLGLCILPGVVIFVLLQMGPYAVLDRGLSPWAAVRLSARLASQFPGPSMLVAAVNGLAIVLGSLFLGLLTLVTLPLACLFTAHMYRQLNREPIA